MRRHFFSLLLLFLSALSSAKPVLVLATAEWPPYVSATLKGEGSAASMLRNIMAAAGYDVRYRYESWPRVEALVESGEVYAGFPYLDTAERRKRFDFSRPFVRTDGYFFYFQQKIRAVPVFNTLADLRSFRLVTPRGYWFEPLFRQQGLQVQYSENELHSLRLLMAGRADFAPLTYDQGWFLIRQNFPQQWQQFAVLPRPLNAGDGLGLLVSRRYRDAAAITRAFDRALQQMQADGRFERQSHYDGNLLKLPPRPAPLPAAVP